MILAASHITPRGRAWLESARAARPLHVFEDVCNVIDEDGRVLSVQTDRLPLNPVSMEIPAAVLAQGRLDGFRGWIGEGDAIDVRESSLILDDHEIEWTQAELWDPRPDWARVKEIDWEAARPWITSRLRSDSPPGGLAPLVGEQGDLIEAGAAVIDDQDGLAGQILRTARPLVGQLLPSLRGTDVGEAEMAARALAGLGGGLTPSGDDLLIGVMHALWAVFAARGARAKARPLARAAAPRTTALSAAWLWAASDGETTRVWHDLFDALAASEEPEMGEVVARLLRVGHSSGSDALAGFVLGLGAL